MSSAREQFFYGALVGVGAAALGAGAFLGTLGLWRYSYSRQHHHGHHSHCAFGDEEFDRKHLKSFVTGQYAPTDELMMFPFIPREGLDFNRRCADICIRHKQEGVVSTALEIGCAAGRTSFELSRGFDSVLGVDISQAFIDKCNEIKTTGQTEYWMPGEGELGDTKTAFLSSDIHRDRVQFVLGDAHNLQPLGEFGCLFCSNILCAIKDPRKFLQDTHKFVAPGGNLIMAENYMRHDEESYKDKSTFLGGYKDEDGVEVRVMDTLNSILSPHFELVEAFDIPVLSMEERRMWFMVADQVTIWRRTQS